MCIQMDEQEAASCHNASRTDLDGTLKSYTSRENLQAQATQDIRQVQVPTLKSPGDNCLEAIGH